MNQSNDSTGTIDSTALLRDGYQLDLTSPPTRAQVGLAPGQATSVRNLPEQATFEAVVRFPDHTTLSTPANVLIATAGADDAPRRVELVRYGMSADDVDQALRAAINELDASAGAVNSALDLLHQKPTSRFQRVISTRVGEGDSLELILVVDPSDDDMHLTYGIALT